MKMKEKQKKEMKRDLMDLISFLLFTPLAVFILKYNISKINTSNIETGEDLVGTINTAMTNEASLIIAMCIEMFLAYFGICLLVKLLASMIAKIAKLAANSKKIS